MAIFCSRLIFLGLLWNGTTKSELGDSSYEDKLFGLSITGRKCPMDCTFNSTSAVALSQDDFIGKLQASIKENRMDLVAPNRLRATALLTKSAILSCTPGDIVETGVFSGGSSAMIMRVLLDLDRCNRKFWAFDSFEGLPALAPQDNSGGLIKGTPGDFKYGQKEFVQNMKKLGAWDHKRIVVTKGWFKDTAPLSAVKHIVFLRLDGDLYSSTYDAIVGFYDRVVHGGLIYVDDYGSFNGCRDAIDEFRTQRRIHETMHFIREGDGRVEAVWWRKVGSF